ncbi:MULTISPECIES: sortase B protein-sorting domain-containing protein [Blautia]|uniref:sortase B protein-sorting domain-containing protein n=1 Tax=Blautia TaxID=572511 RepID=UPI000BA3CB5E|nr:MULTISPECIES: sortase B protein-sorting domain-containing protein [Blautia]
MKKKILCLVMAVVMTVGTALTVHAEEFKSDKSWQVNFDGDDVNSNFSSREMAEKIYGILPGDTIELQVDIKNSGEEQTDWYMSNEVLESLEEESKAEGGAYTYKLTYVTPSGAEAVLYNNETVGGEEPSNIGVGLEQATDSLDDFLYLDRLNAGSIGSVHLKVTLDGETQGNGYQNTLARLQMNFAVEKVAPSIVTVKGEDTVIRKTVTGTSNTVRETITRPKTGDTTNILLYSAIAMISGVILLIFGMLSIKKHHENEKGDLKS